MCPKQPKGKAFVPACAAGHAKSIPAIPGLKQSHGFAAKLRSAFMVKEMAQESRPSLSQLSARPWV
jgi:hypothetical protein